MLYSYLCRASVTDPSGEWWKNLAIQNVQNYSDRKTRQFFIKRKFQAPDMLTQICIAKGSEGRVSKDRKQNLSYGYVIQFSTGLFRASFSARCELIMQFSSPNFTAGRLIGLFSIRCTLLLFMKILNKTLNISSYRRANSFCVLARSSGDLSCFTIKPIACTDCRIPRFSCFVPGNVSLLQSFRVSTTSTGER